MNLKEIICDNVSKHGDIKDDEIIYETITTGDNHVGDFQFNRISDLVRIHVNDGNKHLLISFCGGGGGATKSLERVRDVWIPLSLTCLPTIMAISEDTAPIAYDIGFLSQNSRDKLT